jgi:DNA-directed RNA polymerase subunit M/transcription elongation factor TFIIS
MVLFFKSCPKCRGDMFLDQDVYGSYRQCLQCGKVQDLDTPAAATGLSAPAQVAKKAA